MNLSKCPICNGEVLIKEYHCNHCNVSFKGSFSSHWLEGLDAQQLEFIRLFIIVQGNIKEMEKRLNISYPTVKSRIAEIINKIAPTQASNHIYEDILNDLEQGFIDVTEAIEQIETRRKK